MPCAEPLVNGPVFFGVRHLSPAGGWHLRQLLQQRRPRLVLVEGPSDATSLLPDLTRPQTKPPVALLAYTQKAPVRTVLFPFAEYSPEYQAALWCAQNGAECRFIDLPTSTFLALAQLREQQLLARLQQGDAEPPRSAEDRHDVYAALNELCGEDDHETFWERTLEHTVAPDAYRQGAGEFGAQLRSLTEGKDEDWPETVLREAYMRRRIADALAEGYAPEEVVVVTGAYHVEGLRSGAPITDKELRQLPALPASLTLMPYSYYRLSSRSGYGAGNKAPAYYALLWQELCEGAPGLAARSYLSRIAAWQRQEGENCSPAAVIEAVRLAGQLAALRGGAHPTLRDLRDAAVTVLGEGSLPRISRAVADTEIGTVIGTLPEGVSRTSIQQDFYARLADLRLERYRTPVAQDLALDLREKRTVKSEKSAFLDLERSFFLHRLRVLELDFAQLKPARQTNATWAEDWTLCWTPEAEIQLVEAALKGDTVELAAAYQMKQRMDDAPDMTSIAAVLEDAFTCGMPHTLRTATAVLQAMAVDAAGLEQLAATAARLSLVVQYGSLRRIDPAPLVPILQQLLLRACLILPGECICDDGGAKVVLEAMGRLNSAVLLHDFLDDGLWRSTLQQIAARDDLNTRLSGYAAAILLERGDLTAHQLETEVCRRLSPGVPAELGAGWFEGLAMKNRYGLIARLSLWESLSQYLDTLTDEEFKRALVFLRRAFADFTSGEKDQIAENLGELWELNPQQVSAVLNGPATAAVAELDDFDFDDI